MRMIAIHGAYYSNNFGDLLLIKLFESWIRSRVDCEIACPMVPERQRERFGCEFPGVSFVQSSGRARRR